MTTLQGKTVAVIGAGVAGLAAAYRLQQKGAKVTVFEKCDFVGGRTRTLHLGGFIIDVGALILHSTYKNVRGLLKELGAENHIYTLKPSIAIVRNGKRHVIDYKRRLGSLLRTRLLSWPSKLKLLKLGPIMLRNRLRFNHDSMGDIAPLDSESTRDFCLRELNGEIDDYLANPFIRAGSLTSSSQAPAGEWFWQMMGFAAPSVMQFDEGMDFYARSLARGLDVRLNTAVDKVSVVNGRATLLIGPDRTSYDACVLAVPPPVAHAIAPSTTPQQEKFFGSVKPVPLISLHLGLSRKPDIDESVIILPEKESRDLLLIILDHNKAPGRAPEGKGIVTIWPTIEWTTAHMNASDEQIAAELSRLAEPHVGKVDGLVEVSHVYRWDYVCSITHTGYFKLLHDYMETRNLKQPLFFCGDFSAEGVEGATVAGLNAFRHVEQFLAQQ